MNKRSGFTIVELLVVIVVIGVLSAITIVSFAGVSQRAKIASLQSDLTNASTKLKMYQIEYGYFPTTMSAPASDGTICPIAPTSDTKYCIKPSGGNTFTYTPESGSSPRSFSLVIKDSNGNNPYYITESSLVNSGVPVLTWNWADNTNVWNNSGNAVTPNVVSDPSSSNKGTAMLVEFATWNYQFYIDNKGAKWHFNNGASYTITMDVYGSGGYICGTSLDAVDTFSGSVISEPFNGTNSLESDFTANNTWQKITFNTASFAATTGDYYLWFRDQQGMGNWYIGNITVVQN